MRYKKELRVTGDETTG